MADQSDVEQALLNAAEAVREAVNATWTIARGWPNAAELEQAATAGGVLVTVAPRTGFVRNTSRWLEENLALPGVAPSLHVAVSGATATFSGTCSVDQIVGVQVGTTAWAVRCGASDTPVTVAAALATLSGGAAAGCIDSFGVGDGRYSAR